jgi:hypothetical protein
MAGIISARFLFEILSWPRPDLDPAAVPALAAVHCGALVTTTPVNDIPKSPASRPSWINQATVADPQEDRRDEHTDTGLAAFNAPPPSGSRRRDHSA